MSETIRLFYRSLGLAGMLEVPLGLCMVNGFLSNSLNLFFGGTFDDLISPVVACFYCHFFMIFLISLVPVLPLSILMIDS